VSNFVSKWQSWGENSLNGDIPPTDKTDRNTLATHGPQLEDSQAVPPEPWPGAGLRDVQTVTVTMPEVVSPEPVFVEGLETPAATLALSPWKPSPWVGPGFGGPCYDCGIEDRWQDKHGILRCRACYPPQQRGGDRHGEATEVGTHSFNGDHTEEV
jgi:hypothetical protein